MLALAAIAVETGFIGARSAKGFQPKAQFLAGAMQDDAGITAGQPERGGGLGDVFIIHFYPTQEFSLQWLERGQKAFEAATNMLVTLFVPERSGFERPKILSFSKGLMAAHVVDNSVPKHLVEPRYKFFALVHGAGCMQGLGQTVLQKIFRIGLVSAQTGSEESFKLSTTSEKLGQINGLGHTNTLQQAERFANGGGNLSTVTTKKRRRWDAA